MKELNEASAGTTVTMAIGEQMRVTLADTAGTGFRWTGGEACGKVLRLDQESAISPRDIKPGAPGKRTWQYTAAAAGSCELQYVLARSWEKVGSGRTVSFRVTVGGKSVDML